MIVRVCGVVGSVDVEMSSDKGCEKYPCCKPKVFWGRLILLGLAGF